MNTRLEMQPEITDVVMTVPLAPHGDISPQDLIRALQKIVGRRHVLTGRAVARFVSGFRHGGGSVEAVVRPGSLVEQWEVLKLILAAARIVLPQAANTSLTGGSTPFGVYDRGVVLISTTRISGIHLLDGGTQAVCLGGATLFDLEKRLRPLGREPHSVIGSSCIGASVLGGVCNNSGGALVRRGPAFTQFALFARVDASGDLQLVNHLGMELGSDPVTVLKRLEAGDFRPDEILYPSGRQASDHGYADHVRHIDAPTPARFNADPSRLFEASGSGGKLMLFAVRVDTFPADVGPQTFYIGTNDAAELTQLRREILGTFKSLPVAGEYLHSGAFDLAEHYGKDNFWAIRALGTDRLPTIFAAKAWLDDLTRRTRFLPTHFADRALQAVSRILPRHLPRRMIDFRNRFEHHLMLKMEGEGVEEARRLLAARFPSAAGDFFECSSSEGEQAFLHRFVVAGAAIRYRAIHDREVEDIVALDLALRRNDENWVEELPAEMERPIIRKLYYGHFFCHVFHQDYIVAKGTNPAAFKERLCELLDERGAEYPAEHNVGHMYHAKPPLADHYRALDPTNTFNPGVGQLSRRWRWVEPARRE